MKRIKPEQVSAIRGTTPYGKRFLISRLRIHAERFEVLDLWTGTIRSGKAYQIAAFVNESISEAERYDRYGKKEGGKEARKKEERQ